MSESGGPSQDKSVTDKCGTSDGTKPLNPQPHKTAGTAAGHKTAVIVADDPPPVPERIPGSLSPSQLPPLPPRSRPPQSHQLPPPQLQPVVLPATAAAPSSSKDRWLSKIHPVERVTTLQELSESKENLPAVIRFVDGFYGQTSRFSLCTGDCFQIQFLKQSRVLNVQETSRRSYAVPLASTMKLGLLLDEGDSSQTPLTVPGILALKKLPRVLCAVTGSRDKKGRETVSEGDLLIVREKKQKVLKCLNLTSESDTLLQKNSGTFAVDPESTKMHPLDLVQHVSDVFPCRAQVYQEGSGRSVLVGKQVIVKGCITEVCLVASEVVCGSEERGGVIYFPADGKLSRLQVEILDIENKQCLYDDAREVLQSFDPSSGTTYSDVETDTAFDIQSALYQRLRKDLAKAEVELLTSEVLNEGTSLQTESSTADKLTESTEKVDAAGTMVIGGNPCNMKQPVNDSESEDDEYEEIPPALSPPRPPPVKPRNIKPSTPPLPMRKPRKPVKHSPSLSTESAVTGVYSTIPDVKRRTNSYPRPPVKPRPRSRAPTVSDTHTHTPSQSFSVPIAGGDGYTTLKPRPSNTEEPYETISDHPSHPPPITLVTPHRVAAKSNREKKENRTFLKGLSPSQVLQLLDALNLSQYKRRFEEEVIAGDILADCDDITLEKELGVTMRIHRLKLLQMISGESSAKHLIQ